MKKILFSLALLLSSILLNAQTISLGTDNEYCPNVEYEFSVTLPGAYSSISVTQMLITQQPYAFNSSNTSFKFKAKFNDVNIKQSVEIKYGANGASTFKPEYKKVKSLFYSNDASCTIIQPKFSSNNASATSFTAPLCLVSNFAITFSKIKWHTAFETPTYCFGSISDYEYLLPANWKLGNITSNGTTWLQGTNAVTITSDLTSGNGQTILIRPKNTCVSNSANTQVPAQIIVLRPEPNLTFAATQAPICNGGNKTITLNNIPSGATVNWVVSFPNNGQLQITGCSDCPSVTLQNSGTDNVIGTVTATVQHCSFTYVKNYNVILGSPPYASITPITNYCLGGSDWELVLQASTPDPTVTQYFWSRDGVPSGSGATWSTYEFPPSCMTIGLKAENACGLSPEGTQQFCPPCSFRMVIAPNPVKGQLNIILEKKFISKENVQKSKIIFRLTKVGDLQPIRQWTYNIIQSNYSMNLSNLKQGIYNLQMIIGNEQESKQIVVVE